MVPVPPLNTPEVALAKAMADSDLFVAQKIQRDTYWRFVFIDVGSQRWRCMYQFVSPGHQVILLEMCGNDRQPRQVTRPTGFRILAGKLSFSVPATEEPLRMDVPTGLNTAQKDDRLPITRNVTIIGYPMDNAPCVALVTRIGPTFPGATPNADSWIYGHTTRMGHEESEAFFRRMRALIAR